MADGGSPMTIMKRKREIQAPRGLQSMLVGIKVGEGTFGQVFKAVDRSTSDVTALKRIKTDERHKEYGFPISALREIRHLKTLKCPNIVNMKEVIICNEDDMKSEQKQYFLDHGIEVGDVFVVQEFCPFNLNQIIYAKHKFMPDALKRHYIKQLLDGVFFIHCQKVLHRDLKPENILVTADNILKIADWGSVRSIAGNAEQLRLSNQVITLWYRCPDVIFGSRTYGPEVDMWSVGCIIYEILIGRAPFRSDQQTEILEQIFRVCGSPDTATKEKYSKSEFYNHYKKCIPENAIDTFADVTRGLTASAVNIVKSMICLNPSQRATAAAACDAPYLWESLDNGVFPRFNPDEVIDIYNDIRKKYDDNKKRKDDQIAAGGCNAGMGEEKSAGGSTTGVKALLPHNQNQLHNKGGNVFAQGGAPNNQNKFRVDNQKKGYAGPSKFKVSSGVPAAVVAGGGGGSSSSMQIDSSSNNSNNNSGGMR